MKSELTFSVYGLYDKREEELARQSVRRVRITKRGKTMSNNPRLMQILEEYTLQYNVKLDQAKTNLQGVKDKALKSKIKKARGIACYHANQEGFGAGEMAKVFGVTETSIYAWIQDSRLYMRKDEHGGVDPSSFERGKPDTTPESLHGKPEPKTPTPKTETPVEQQELVVKKKDSPHGVFVTDPELIAMQVIVDVLTPLDESARNRAIAWAMERF